MMELLEPVVLRRVGEGGVTEMMEAEEGWRRDEAGMAGGVVEVALAEGGVFLRAM